MRCPVCGSEHAEEQVPGSPFSLTVCPSLPEDRWLLVQAPRQPTPPTFLDLMVVPTKLAAQAREIQAEPARPPWEADWSRLFP